MGQTITFATSNLFKMRNAKQALAEFGFNVKRAALDLAESRATKTEEIAHEKALQAFQALKRPVIAEDSGFYIHALNGFPQTYLHHTRNTLGLGGILKLMRGVDDRYCEWRMSLCFVGRDGKKLKVFTHTEPGTVADTVQTWGHKNHGGSEYWQIFCPTNYKNGAKALAALSPKELAEWDAHFNKHSQYYMLGQWIKSNPKLLD